VTSSANDYHFVTWWRLEATCGEVADILGDPLSLPRWWPSVYLSVEQLEPPKPDGTGRRVLLRTKGWLPYTLRWESVIVDSRYPHGFTLDATGDFEGRGVWTFEPDDKFVNVVYDWRIRAEKPLLRELSFLLRPLFEANHRWAMAQGAQSLALELQRRRSLSDEERAQVPPPPGPVTYAAAALVGGAALTGAALAYLVISSRNRRRRRRRLR
jgi:Polyketide cyclase / dehydrase and lipid transport